LINHLFHPEFRKGGVTIKRNSKKISHVSFFTKFFFWGRGIEWKLIPLPPSNFPLILMGERDRQEASLSSPIKFSRSSRKISHVSFFNKFFFWGREIEREQIPLPPLKFDIERSIQF